MTSTRVWVLVACAVCVGCGDPVSGDPDAGDGSPAMLDGGPRDAPAIDGAPDAFVPSIDSGLDAASDAFLSAVDAASETDAAVTIDAYATVDAAPDDGGVLGRRDVIRPRVTVEQGATQADPATTQPIVFDVRFDEVIDVRTLTGSDFVVTPAAFDPTRALSDTGDHRHFQLRLSNLPAVDEQYGVSLPDGAATDRAGNPNEASTGLDGRVRFDQAGPTVEIFPFAVVPVTNVFPIHYQIQFQRTVTAAGFTAASIVNGGTAPGVVWTLTPLNPGYAYQLDATAASGTGTIIPVVPAGASVDVMTAAPTLASAYNGTVTTYSPLPILMINDAQGNEGDTVFFNVQFYGTMRSSTPTTFDWTTSDGTAIAGSDYTATSATDVTIPAGVSGAPLQVPAVPEDLTPEPHRRFQVHISNVRGSVFVFDDTATGTIVNDDGGYYSFGGNAGTSPNAGPFDIRLWVDDLWVFGNASGGSAQLVRYARATGTSSGALGFGFGANTAGGFDLNARGYYFARTVPSSGFTLTKYDYASRSHDDAFGLYGDVVVSDATDTLSAMDVVTDADHVYVAGQRTTPAGDSRWIIECHDGATGVLCPGFGTGGVVSIDHAVGTMDEAPSTMRVDGTNLYVLGHAGTEPLLERRSLATGALVAAFGTAGVMHLAASYTRANDFSIQSGSLYLIGIGVTSGLALITQYDALTGAMGWQWGTVMDDPRTIHVSATDLYLGGGRGTAMHVERWMTDGTPIWAHTFNYGLMDGALTALLYEPGSHWLHSVGVQIDTSGQHNWYYDRRYVPDGFTYTNAPTAPPY